MLGAFATFVIIAVLIGVACLLGRAADSDMPSGSSLFAMKIDAHFKKDNINYERQFELKKMAQSARKEERLKFDQIFGRPLRNGHPDYHDLDWAIYYISIKEGWTYCFPEDRYFSEKEKGKLWAKRQYWYETVYEDQKKWMSWYLKYKDGHPYDFDPGFYPEDYETEEGYHQALKSRYFWLDEEIQEQQKEREAKARLEAGIKINAEAVKLVEALEATNTYKAYIDTLWEFFRPREQTRSQCVAKVYAWILLNYKTVKERASLTRALGVKLKAEKMNTLKRVYAKSVEERRLMFSQYKAFNDDESCAIGIDCMELAWKYNTAGEKETLEFIRDKLFKIVGESNTKLIMEKKFLWPGRAMAYAPLVVYDIFHIREKQI